MSLPGTSDPVYRKTSKGQEAIATRAHVLAARLRSLLILVDGRRSRSALQTLAAGFGEVGPMLAQLEAQGFVELPEAAAQPAKASSTTAPSAGGPASPATPTTIPLAAAKQLATRQLNQILGPTSDVLCLPVEAARNRAEFIEAIQRAYSVVADIRGRAQAEAFGAIIEANLPSA